MVQRKLKMKISIVGTGYVGLVTGISLARLGHRIACIDSDKEKVKIIQSGKPHFFEPGVEIALRKVLKSGNFSVTQDLEKAILGSRVTFIAVGTPTVNNKIDLSFIKSASQQIGYVLSKISKYHLVVVKSTVLPGVTEEVVKPILEKYSGKSIGDFGLCMNPEFLREGRALADSSYPDRIIIGQIDEKSGRALSKIYSMVSTPKVFTNLSTAEMTKYTINSLLATLISFSNEISRIVEHTKDIDVVNVWKGVHLDKRLSPIKGNIRIKPGILRYLISGCGFGGSCLPKDIKALHSFAKKIGTDAKLIRSVIEINETQPHRVIMQLKKAIPLLLNKKIAVLGLSFKPDTNDIRESPAIPIIEELLQEGALVVAHDPMAYKTSVPKQLSNLNIKLAKTVKEAVDGADSVIVVTPWKEYVNLSNEFFSKYMRKPVVIDSRRIYNKKSFMRAGIIYEGIGL